MLTVPDLSQQTDAAVETRPSKTEKWLASLSFINKADTSRQLYIALMALNRQAIDEKTRFKLLELYREPIQRISDELQVEYIDRAQPLFTNLKMLAEQNRKFQAEMAIGYKHIIVEMTRAGKIKPGAKSTFLATLIHRALCYLKEVLLKSYVYYSSVPSGVWQEIHDLYLIAEKTDSGNLEIPDRLNRVNKNTTVTEFYKHVLLLGLSSPYHLPPKLVNKVDHFLHRWASLGQIGLAEDINEGNCQFIIMQQSDSAGHDYSGDKKATSNQQYRLLYTHELSRFIHSKLRALENGETIDPEGLDENFYTERGKPVLLHLINIWGVNPKRQFPRIEKDTAKLELAMGLKAINYFLAGEQFMLPSSEFIGPFPERTAVGTPGTHLHNSRKGKDLTTATWEIADESAGGVSLKHNDVLSDPARVGEIVATKVPEQDNTWEIATIRWMRTTESSNIEIGLQRLAPKATPVLLKVLNEDNVESDFMPALLLPEMATLQQGQTLATHKGIYKEGRALYFDDGARMQKVTATNLIEETSAYERFAFVPFEG